MAVPMVSIWIMHVAVLQRRMDMPMAMLGARWQCFRILILILILMLMLMLMLVTFVVGMLVFMCQHFVLMKMEMPFCQMQPHANRHQAPTPLNKPNSRIYGQPINDEALDPTAFGSTIGLLEGEEHAEKALPCACLSMWRLPHRPARYPFP